MSTKDIISQMLLLSTMSNVRTTGTHLRSSINTPRSKSVLKRRKANKAARKQRRK